MSTPSAHRLIVAPVLHRIDRPRAESLPLSGVLAERAYAQAVQGDLLRLLRARRDGPRPSIPPEPQSPRPRLNLLAYGIPDPVGLDWDDQRARADYEQDVADAIRVFEPRIDVAQVRLEPPAPVDPARLRLSISATLKPPAAPTQLKLAAKFDLRTGELIEEAGDAGP